MAFTNPPSWSNQGSEPPASLKTSGFVAGYKPPAGYFNWFWNRVGVCLDELQNAILGLPVAVYHNSATGFDLDTTTESLMIVTSALSKDCPVTGSEILIQQLFYGETSATSKRTQIAYPYGDSTSNGISVRRYTGTEWSSWSVAGTETLQAEVEELQSALNGKQATITGAATTVASSNLTTNRALVSNASGKIGVSTVTLAELAFLSGVTSNVQEQLTALSDLITSLQTTVGGKQATITGAATTITSSNLTANRALTSNGSGKVDISAVTATELGYLSGVTKAIQTQFGEKADKATTITGTLTAGETSVTLTNSAIKTTSLIDVYTSVFGVNPTNVTVSDGKVVLTFEAQSSAVNVRIEVK